MIKIKQPTTKKWKLEMNLKLPILGWEKGTLGIEKT